LDYILLLLTPTCNLNLIGIAPFGIQAEIGGDDDDSPESTESYAASRKTIAGEDSCCVAFAYVTSFQK
jgi:hypothetical protein